MKAEKIVVRIMNLLLSAFFAFGILVFLEQFSRTGWPWFSRSLRCWPILMCFLVGMVGRIFTKWKYPLLGAGVLVAVGIMLPLWPAYSGLDIAYIVCAATIVSAVYYAVICQAYISRAVMIYVRSNSVYEKSLAGFKASEDIKITPDKPIPPAD